MVVLGCGVICGFVCKLCVVCSFGLSPNDQDVCECGGGVCILVCFCFFGIAMGVEVL